MRNATLIKRYVETHNHDSKLLCEFHKKILMKDVPPLGYRVLYPQDNGIAKFYVEEADIDPNTGTLTLYSTMAISKYENYDYEPSILVMLSMRRREWKIVRVKAEIKKDWEKAQKKYERKEEFAQ